MLRAARHSTDVLVLGAGVAGLACRAALAGEREVTLVEQGDDIGGLTRVHRAGPYVFDTTVHVLFFRSEERRAAILDLLVDGVRSFPKKNLVWQHGRSIEYPYQFNAWALPPAVRDRCIRGLEARPLKDPPTEPSFREWLIAQFGDGFYESFFRPFNEKLYGLPLDELEAGPLTWTIPSDNRAAVLAGANGPPSMGGAIVSYPRGPDGIQALPRALCALGKGPLHLGARVEAIDLDRKLVRTRDGLDVEYRDLVSTLPLPATLRAIAALPVDLVAGLDRLRAAPVTVIRVGAKTTTSALAAHWTYFPEAEFPFHRLVRLEQISADLSPEGHTALLLECPGSRPPPRDVVVSALEKLGLLRASDIEHFSSLVIPFAYVLPLRGYARVVAKAEDYLSSRGVHLAGRFGTWRYSNIEQAIASGVEVAYGLTGRPLTARLFRTEERAGR